MINHDLTKLAALMRDNHAAHKPMRLPALKGREIAALVKLLDQHAANDIKSIH
ncbi:hypothetical protein [Castellaniella sp.]|uniref:hypothetical protein n=1 Tax=Castellaniella sp. TaxID=1955812 RepID=UPI002B00380A|nr:hypothetical protein [Castellaniella sp.]